MNLSEKYEQCEEYVLLRLEDNIKSLDNNYQEEIASSNGEFTRIGSSIYKDKGKYFICIRNDNKEYGFKEFKINEDLAHLLIKEKLSNDFYRQIALGFRAYKDQSQEQADG